MQAAGLATLGAAPLAAGAVLPPDGDVAVLPPCPLLAVTGVPCPLCGATRAFAAAGHGDLPALLDANAVWVAYAVLAVLAAAALAARRVRPRGQTPQSHRLGAPALLAVLALPAWVWALAHRDTIAA